MHHFSVKAVMCISLILVFTATGPAAQAATYSVRVDGASDGVTERSIGATEGCTRFDISDLVDVGLRNYRIWAGMSRLEPVDDDEIYGLPTIAEIKANPNVINWGAWDTHFFRKDSYHFSPVCSTSAQISLYEMLTALRDNGIKAVVTLRNVDNNGQPAWAARLNPPRTAEDWNEWWEHVFATVYSVNVRYGLEVHDWQVHNEPDRGKQGWKGTLQDYIEFTRSTHDAIKYVYDTYLPGKSFRLYAPVATGLNSWVEQSLIQNDAVIEVVDWHNYGSSHYDVAVEANQWIGLYDSDGVQEETFISEWGSYRSAYDNPSNALSYAKILVEHSRDNAGYVTGSAIFPFYDWPAMRGLVHADGSRTPMYYAFRMMIRGLQGGKTRYPIIHNIPSRVDIQPIAAMDQGSRTLYLEVVNRGRQKHSIALDVSSHILSGTATFRQFSSGVNDIAVGTGAIKGGQVSLNLPAISIIQAIIPLGP